MNTENLRSEKLGSDPIGELFDFFERIEFGKKPIPAAEEFINRLTELQEGRRVPVVIFNCLDFQWKAIPQSYPQSTILDGTNTSICSYFEPNIQIYMKKLNLLGQSDLYIIVPDSELFDNRPFSFSQPNYIRKAIGEKVKNNLKEKLKGLKEKKVVFWSEYCSENGLSTPFEYTTSNMQKIKDDPDLLKKVLGQVKDSGSYFISKGMNLNYIKSIKDEMTERTTSYLAMYAGEGQALAESRAIVINLEDQRVSAWFQRGANEKLPILTPVSPTNYYKWRNQKKVF